MRSPCRRRMRAVRRNSGLRSGHAPEDRHPADRCGALLLLGGVQLLPRPRRQLGRDARPGAAGRRDADTVSPAARGGRQDRRRGPPDRPTSRAPTAPRRIPTAGSTSSQGVVRGPRRSPCGRRDVDAVTDYAQYAFPFGEQGTVSDSDGPQTVTIVGIRHRPRRPPQRDRHALLGRPHGHDRGREPGRPRRRRHPRRHVRPRSVSRLHRPVPADPLCGSSADALCVTHAIRVVQRTYEYDTRSPRDGNRRLKQETTYFGPTAADGGCSGCASHTVTFSNSGADTWEGNGRHYGVETHTGNLGGDARTITTDWDAGQLDVHASLGPAASAERAQAAHRDPGLLDAPTATSSSTPRPGS